MIQLCRPFRLAASAIALVVIASALLAAYPREACAHAVLVSSSPIQGKRLAAAPDEFRLRFSEPVAQAKISLIDREGTARALPAAVSGGEVVARMTGSLEDGVYALNWRVISEDGHPVSAAIVFCVGTGDIASFESPATSGGRWLTTLTLAAKFAFYASSLFGVGGIFFAFCIERRPPGGAHLALLLVAGLSAGALLGLLGVELTGSSLNALFSGDVWLAACGSSLARSVAVAGVALVLAGIAIFRPSSGPACSLAAAASLGCAFALTGHASGAGIKWLSFSAVAVHATAAIFWVGALPRLWNVLRSDRPEYPDVLARFSAAIPMSIAAILVAGAYLACLQLGAAEALWQTSYGNVLSVKAILAGTAMGLGAWNRVLLTNRVLHHDLSAALSMRRVVAVEIVLVAAVLAVTSTWRFTPPPRALALQIPVSRSVHLHDATAMATIAFKTKRDLSFDAEVFLQTAAFDEFDPAEVTLRMSAADGSVAAFDVPVMRISPGLWRAAGGQAPCDCDWDIRVEALVSDFDLVTLKGSVRLLSSAEERAEQGQFRSSSFTAGGRGRLRSHRTRRRRLRCCILGERPSCEVRSKSRR